LEAKMALREYRLAISQLGKEIAESIVTISDSSIAEIKAMVTKLKEQGVRSNGLFHSQKIESIFIDD
jgi:hypothetical protein